MNNKCENCSAPIGGFWANLAKFWGVKRSTTHSNLCNKCAPGGDMPVDKMSEDKPANTTAKTQAMPEAKPIEESKPNAETPSMTHTCSGPGCTHPSHKNEPNGSPSTDLSPGASAQGDKPADSMGHKCSGPGCTDPSHKKEM